MATAMPEFLRNRSGIPALRAGLVFVRVPKTGTTSTISILHPVCQQLWPGLGLHDEGAEVRT